MYLNSFQKRNVVYKVIHPDLRKVFNSIIILLLIMECFGAQEVAIFVLE